MRIGWSGWSVEVPGTWAVTDHPECMTLELSEQGALQLSSATKRSGVVLAEELQDFADGKDEHWGHPEATTCGEFQGVVCSCEREGQVWRRWFLSNESTVVFVTYNGDGEVAQHELQSAATVLDSLRAERAAA